MICPSVDHWEQKEWISLRVGVTRFITDIHSGPERAENMKNYIKHQSQSKSLLLPEEMCVYVCVAVNVC